MSTGWVHADVPVDIVLYSIVDKTKKACHVVRTIDEMQIHMKLIIMIKGMYPWITFTTLKLKDRIIS